MCDNKGKPFIAKLYNVLLAPDLYNFSLNYYVDESGTYLSLIWIYLRGFIQC